jgi:[ribosomal protein S18]-alanine N-acetyltransferase
MTSSDIEGVRAMAAVLPHAPHWTHAAWETLLCSVAPRRVLLSAEAAPGVITGFAIASLMPPEAELESVAVAPEFQRQGIARALIQAIEAEIRAAGVTVLLLEVRPSNASARALYHALGFAQIGRRPGYYADPTEDALLLQRELH